MAHHIDMVVEHGTLGLLLKTEAPAKTPNGVHFSCFVFWYDHICRMLDNRLPGIMLFGQVKGLNP